MPLDTASPEVSGNDRFAFLVNGVRHTTNDAILQGRDILQKAGFNPASEHVLIELTRPGSVSRGLDEDIDLSQPGREEFRAFESDRTFNFTVDERGYEWGAQIISEPELRDITGTPDGKVFALERQDEQDQLVEGGNVDLASRGTEHIRTEKRLARIIVNAREVRVGGHEVNFAEVVSYAFNPVPTGPDVAFTITYRKGPPENPKGSMVEGISVSIKNGMVFNVSQTNRS